MTPIEFIFLGLLGGVLLAVIGYVLFVSIRTLREVRDKLDLLLKHLDPERVDRGIGALAMMGQSVPPLVAGLEGLARVMGVFNGLMMKRDKSEAGTISTNGMTVAGDGSRFDGYDESVAAAQEQARKLRNMGLKISDDYPNPPTKDRMFFAGEAENRPTPPPPPIPHVQPDNAAVAGAPDAFRMATAAPQPMTPTPVESDVTIAE